jgi:hypothetical protein
VLERRLDHDIWTPTTQYADRLAAQRDERKWRLSDRQIETACSRLKPHAGPLHPSSCNIWLGTTQRTIKELCSWVGQEWGAMDGDLCRDEAFALDAGHLRLLCDRRHRPVVKPSRGTSLHPVGLDLQAGRGESLRAIRRTMHHSRLAGFDVLVLLALSPQAIPQIGRELPRHWWLPALQARVGRGSQWDHAPLLWRGKRYTNQLIVQAGWQVANGSDFIAVTRRHGMTR